MTKLRMFLGFLSVVTCGTKILADPSVCSPLCATLGCDGEGTIKTFHMTPLWLESHAWYINSDRSTSAAQITFNAGSTAHAALLKVVLVPAGVLTDDAPLSVQITVANDIAIGKTADSDIKYGVSDGSKFIGFESPDQGNYGNHGPCYGCDGVPGSTLSSIRRDPVTPKTTDSVYPGQFVYTLKLDERWGSCYTAHDSGFVRTANYNDRLMLSKGLTLEVYKGDKGERVGIKFIKVTLSLDS
ncbi:uncharacterized protein [Montipora foliosa]|uniref:uncharacterized protein isoform X1 n=1 Tax=Montipora foliosa TaxID=591990 RepID=UPI0035F11121